MKVLLLFLISFFPCFLSLEELKLSMSQFKVYTSKVKKDSKSVNYKIILSYWAAKYLRIRTKPTDPSNPAYIYLSGTVEEVKRKDAILLSEEEDLNQVHLSKYDIEEKKEFFLGIECLISNCDFELYFKFDTTMLMGRSQITHFIGSDGGYYVTITRGLDNLPNKSGTLTVFATTGGVGEITSSTLEYTYPGEGDYDDDEYFPITNKGSLVNGVVYLVNEKDKNYEDDTGDYVFRIFSKTKKGILKAGSRVIEQKTKIYPNKPPLYQHIDNSLLKQECFTLVDTMDEEKLYSIEVITYTENIEVNLVDKEGVEIPDRKWTVTNMKSIQVKTSDLKDNDICLKTFDSKKGTFSIQILDLKNLDPAMDEPLLNGIMYTKSLFPNQVTYYRHSKYSKDSKETNFNMRIIKGNPQMFVHKCTDFPNCKYTVSSVKSLIGKPDFFNPLTVGNFYTYAVNSQEEKSYINSLQYLMIIMCDSEVNCEFEVSFNDDIEQMNINPESKFSRYKVAEANDAYVFKVTDKSISKVAITLSSFSGDGYILLDEVKKPLSYKTYSAINKQIFEFDTASQINEIGQLTFQVKSTKKTYYTIEYSTFQNAYVSLPTNVMYLETIKKEEKSKVFRFVRKNKSQKGTFVSTFYSLNCQVQVTYNNKNEVVKPVDNLSQHQVSPNENEYEYTITILEMDQENPIPNELCIISMGASILSLSEERPMLINEATPVQFILSKEVQKVSYVFPHAMSEGNLIATFVLEDEALLQVKIGFGKKQRTLYEMHRNKQIIFSSEQIQKNCDGETEKVCNFFFEIYSTDNVDLANEIMFTFTVKSESGIPSFLTKNLVREDVAYTGKPQYYYTDVSQGEEGEVVLNINRGGGKMFARLVDKLANETDANWKGTFVLPTESSKDVLAFYENSNKILYTKSDSSKCKNGCNLFIAVLFNDMYKEQNSFVVNDYSIYVKASSSQEKRNVVDIPVNEHIQGEVTKTKSDSYRLYVPNESSRIVIELISDMCEIYVNYGTEIPTKEDSTWHFDSSAKEEVFVISRNDAQMPSEGKNSLKYKYFTFTVKAKILGGITKAKYSIKVRTPKYGFTDVIEISSDRTDLCLAEAKSYCYFTIPIRDYYLAKKLTLYARSSKETVIRLYGKYSEDFDSLDESGVAKALPTPKDFEYRSETDQPFIYIDKVSSSKDDSFLISVYSKNKAVIQMHSTLNSNTIKSIPNPSTAQLYNMPKNSVLALSIPSDNSYTVKLTSINGKGYFVSPSSADFIKLEDFENTLTLNVPKASGKREDLTVKNNSTEKEFSFAFEYFIATEEDNLYEIKLFEEMETYLLSNDFPLTFYSKIENEEEAVQFKGELLSLDNPEDKPIGAFTISAYVIDEDFLYKRKSNKDEKIVANEIPGIYAIASAQMEVIITSDNMKDYQTKNQKYILIVIKQTEENTDSYQKIHAKFSETLRDRKKEDDSGDTEDDYSKYLHPEQKTYNIKVATKGKTEPILYLLEKSSSDNNKLRLEFFSDSPRVDFALVDYEAAKGLRYLNSRVLTSDNIHLYLNSSTIKIEKETTKNEKRILVADITSNDKLILSILPANEDKMFNNENYAFRYETSNDFKEYVISEDDLKFEYDKKKKILDVTLQSIKYEGSPVKAKYNAYVIDPKKVSKNASIQFIGFFGISVEKMYQIENELSSFHFIMADFPSKKDYTVIISGTVQESGEILSYKSISIEQGGSKRTLIIVLVVVLVLICIAVGGVLFYFLYYKKKKGNRKNNNNVNIHEYAIESEPRPIITENIQPEKLCVKQPEQI